MAHKNVHTTYSHDAKNWRNITEGSSKPSKVYETKAEAQSAGRALAIRNQSEQLIHNKDGKIAERNSYGNDSFPPRG